MKTLTDIILKTKYDDRVRGGKGHPNSSITNTYLYRKYGIKLKKFRSYDKGIHLNVFKGTIEAFDTDAFLEFFRHLDWQYPEYMELKLNTADNLIIKKGKE